MFKLEDNFLRDIGLGSLSDEEKESLLQYVYKELEVRVGVRLSEGMNDESLGMFEKLMQSNQKEALSWLEDNRPNYKRIVVEELAKLQQEVINNKNRILSTEGANV